MAAIVVVMETQATPVSTHLSIDNPCGRDLAAFDSTPTFLAIERQIRLTLGDSNSLISKMETAKLAYNNSDRLTEDEVTQYTQPWYNLQGLPTRHSVSYDYDQPEYVQHLQQDYQDISTFLVFLQHTQDQQYANNENVLRNELRHVEQAFFSLLCRLDTLLRQKQVTVTDFVSSQVIPDNLRHMSKEKERYRRDFLLLKDSTIYVRDMIGDFETFLRHVSESE